MIWKQFADFRPQALSFVANIASEPEAMMKFPIKIPTKSKNIWFIFEASKELQIHHSDWLDEQF